MDSPHPQLPLSATRAGCSGLHALVEDGELLVGANLSRAKVCGAGGCRWYFLDKTENGQRNWRSRGCAKRENVKRHYYRHRTRPTHSGR